VGQGAREVHPTAEALQQRLAVATTEVAPEGFGHEVLADGPGQASHAQREEQASGEDAGVGVATSVVKGVVSKVDPEGGKDGEKCKAQVFVFFHFDGLAFSGGGICGVPRLMEVAPTSVGTLRIMNERAAVLRYEWDRVERRKRSVKRLWAVCESQ
jgi:hypothetical protein